jgi:hypothetical protein
LIVSAVPGIIAGMPQPSPYPRWMYYPSWRQPPEWVNELLVSVRTSQSSIDSNVRHLKSNDVLALLRPRLIDLGYEVEGGADRYPLPVLFGQDGRVAKSFNVDAFRPHDAIAVEIEAGGAFENNRILYDLVKMVLGVVVDYGVLIVPQKYETENRRFRDQYEESRKLFDAIWANPERLKLPLEGLLLVGY